LPAVHLSLLSKLGKTFVTTNYDEWLDDEIVPPTTDVEGEAGGSADVAPRARTVYFKLEDLAAANLNRQDVVIHQHGSVKAFGGSCALVIDLAILASVWMQDWKLEPRHGPAGNSG